MAMAPLAPGDPRRIGDYWLAGRLGEGGQGVVYEAYDEAGRRVALKALRLSSYGPFGGVRADAAGDAHGDGGGASGGFDGWSPGDADLRARFAREAAAARRVSSFCTAKIIAADLEGAQPYIVSEFVGGPSLRRAIERNGPYGPDDLYRLATGIATALTAIHEASVIHRDLKPDNVLIGPDGPRVIDFGIARTTEMSLTTTGHVAGTPAFMAPESVLGQRAGPAVDIWAWGAVTLYAATGREPFALDPAGEAGGDFAGNFGGNNVAAFLHRILAADPDVSMLQEPLRGLVVAAMAKDPSARPSSPELLMRLLRGQDADGREAGGRGPGDGPERAGATGAQEPGGGTTGAGRPGAGRPGGVARPAGGRAAIGEVPGRGTQDGEVPGGEATRGWREEERAGATALLLAEGRRAAEAMRPPADVAPPSLAALAEDIYTSLGAADQAVVPQILLRMVMPGEGSDDLPRKVRADELLDGVVDLPTADRVLSGFARAELLVREGDTMSLASAALLRAWPRLREWIEADRAGLRVHRQLSEAARLWDENGRRPGDLYQGTSLDNALGWAATGRQHVTLNLLENAFLDASAALGRLRGRRRRQVTAVLAVLLAAALASAGVAVDQKAFADRQRASAERQRDTAVARRTAALADSLRSADPVTAMALSVAAWRLAGVPEARAALYSSLAQRERDISPPPPVTAAARFDLSADGRTLAIADQGRVVLWDVVARRRIRAVEGVGARAAAVAVSPDARLVAVAGAGSLQVWDAVSGRPLGPRFGTGALEMTFGPGGRLLAVVSPGHHGQVWDPRTGGKVLEVARDGRIEDVVVSDRFAAATFRDGRVRLWDLARRRKVLAPGGGRGEAAAFSPDGTTLAVSRAGDVRFWDLASGRHRDAVLEGAGAAWLSYSDDGRYVMTYDHKGIGLWDAAGGRPIVYQSLSDTSGMPVIRMGHDHRALRYLLGGGGVATVDVRLGTRPVAVASSAVSAAFAPGARTLAVQTGDLLELWDAGQGRRLGSLPSSAEALAFSPDGRTLAAGTAELAEMPPDPPAGTADPTAGPAAQATTQPSAGTANPPAGSAGEAAALPPDGTATPGAGAGPGDQRPDDRGVAADADQTAGSGAVTLWDVAGMRRTTAVAVPGAASVGGLAFGPGLVAVAPFSGDWQRVRLWDASHHAWTRVLPRAGVDVMAFRPDGRVLAIGGQNSALVDLATGAVTDQPFGPSLDGVRSIAFSPDGSTVAVGFHQLGVGLWDTRTAQPTGRLAPDPGDLDDVVAIAFSPDGRLVATGGTSGEVRLWDAATHVPLGRPYTAHTGVVLALSFGGDGRYLYSAGEDGTLQRYTVDPGRATAEVCARAGAPLSMNDWRRLIPEAPYRKVC
ncbi:protein kinase [Planotetraspora sp. A-T 1434]|uniref:WD40 repeat domain-containing serine/threonine protein kinase n=1 Tax=Planotetraspora sp. A-T 1434 TaxID=2979219 RepID=UPI0021C13CA4|nr:protein kinase [Planotetraspora sp. A-T 1434]MCT9934409.1 protein kinase [Planotetraspora sp. A-T 1434]